MNDTCVILQKPSILIYLEILSIKEKNKSFSLNSKSLKTWYRIFTVKNKNQEVLDGVETSHLAARVKNILKLMSLVDCVYKNNE